MDEPILNQLREKKGLVIDKNAEVLIKSWIRDLIGHHKDQTIVATTALYPSETLYPYETLYPGGN